MGASSSPSWLDPLLRTHHPTLPVNNQALPPRNAGRDQGDATGAARHFVLEWDLPKPGAAIRRCGGAMQQSEAGSGWQRGGDTLTVFVETDAEL